MPASQPNSSAPAATQKLGTRHPLLYASVSFALGILGGTYFWRPPSWWLVALAVFVGAASYLAQRRPRIARALSFGTLTLLGAFIVEVHGPAATPSSDIIQFADGGEVVVIAHVTRDGFLRDGGYGGKRQSVELESDQVTSGSLASTSTAGIRLNIYTRSETRDDVTLPTHSGMPLFTYGQRLRVKATLRPPRNFGNPGAFDYQGYLVAPQCLRVADETGQEFDVILWSPSQAALI